MFKLTSKGLWSHKVRFLLTGLAVVLGVSFMAGTMILTDTMGKTFDGLFATSNQGIDVVVHHTTGVKSDDGDVTERVDAATLARIRTVPGVDGIPGFTVVAADDTTAQAMFAQPGAYDSVVVAAAKGVSPQQLVQRVTAAVGAPGLEVKTGAADTKDKQTKFREDMSFFSTF